MNYVSFSTASDLELDVNISGLPTGGRVCPYLASGLMPFPQILPQSMPTILSFVFNEMAQDVHFFTRSTTSTKNTYKFNFLSRLRDTNKTAEVRHAIQR